MPIVFDSPGRKILAPKSFEHRHRDDSGTLYLDHQHAQFSDDSEILQKWRDHLQCRELFSMHQAFYVVAKK